jgi:hypothetical protein
MTQYLCISRSCYRSTSRTQSSSRRSTGLYAHSTLDSSYGLALEQFDSVRRMYVALSILAVLPTLSKGMIENLEWA